MAEKFDDEFFAEVGLSEMPTEDRDGLIGALVEDLEMKVGSRLAADLTGAQLGQFEKLMAANDQEGALAWLNENSPGYKDVVQGEVDRVKEDLKRRSGEILAACTS